MENINEHYTLGEEIANSITHGVGAAFGITALVLLDVFAALEHSAVKVVAGSIFGATIIILYMASTLYHSIQVDKARRVLKTLDHASIYLLIAGTYTPFCLITLHGGWGWSLFGIVWGMAFFGIIFKLFFVHKFNILSTIIYLSMGWLAIVAIKPLIHLLSFPGLMWMVAGGLCYTFGVIFYLLEKMKYSHSIWHIFVLAGTVCHFVAVLGYVIL